MFVRPHTPEKRMDIDSKRNDNEGGVWGGEETFTYCLNDMLRPSLLPTSAALSTVYVPLAL